MRFKLTVILILLNVALAAAIIYLAQSPASGDRSGAGERLVLPVPIVEGADYLRLESPALREPWELERVGAEDWFLREPIAWPANPFAVNRIFRALRFLEWDARFSLRDLSRAGQRLEDYGLEEPRAVLTVGAGADRLEIRIGQATALGNRLYLLSPDQGEIYVVNRELLASLSVDVDHLHGNAVLRIPVFEIRGVQVQRDDSNGTRIRLRRNRDGWNIEAPLQARAESRKVEAALKRAYAMQVRAFPAVDESEHGLQNPRLRITFEGNNRRQTLLVGSRVSDGDGDAVYARLEDNPTIFTVAEDSLESFWEPHVTLRDRRLFHFDPDAITMIEVAGSDRSITLHRLETGAWQVLRSEEANRLERWPADPEVIAGILNKLSRLEAVRFGSDAPGSEELRDAGLDHPQRRITMHGTSDHTLLLGALEPGPNLLWIGLGDSDTLYQIEPDVLHALPLNPLHYRSRTIETLPRAAVVRSIELTELREGNVVVSEEIVPGDSSWEEQWVDRPDRDLEALLALRNSIRRFRVDRFLQEGFEDPMRLDSETTFPWRFRLDSRITLPGSGGSEEERTIRYYFSERVGALTQFGGSPSHNLIFTLPQPLMDAFRVLTADRADPASPAVVEEPPEDAITPPEELSAAEEISVEDDSDAGDPGGSDEDDDAAAAP